MTEPTLTKRCTRCGGEFPDEALFCPTCGEAQARSAEDPLLGKVLAERYLLTERIGQGGSGTVYRAEHVTLRRKAAVKILHHQLSTDDTAIERFRREATTVAAIENEHILEVLDFGRAEDGRLYFAMELLEGETLAAVLAREHQLSVERMIDVLTQIGEALMEAHGMGYVHRDLRPRNIFLTRKHGRDGFVKLLDFGLAKLIHPEGEAHQTSLGMTFGDPRYMSPEQARGAPVDRRADIYSLGIIGYEMVTGQPPFSGGPTFQLLTKHLEEAPTPPSSLRPDLPPFVASALMTALAKKKEDRFVTVLRMIESLTDGLAALAAAAPAPAIAPEPRAPEPAARPAPVAAEVQAVLDAAPTAPTSAPAASGAEPVSGRTLTYMPKARPSAERAAARPSAERAAARPSTERAAARPSAERAAARPSGTRAAEPRPATATGSRASKPPGGTMSGQWFAAGDAGVDTLTELTASRAGMEASPTARLGLWLGVAAAAVALTAGAIWLWAGRSPPVVAPASAPAVAPPRPTGGAAAAGADAGPSPTRVVAPRGATAVAQPPTPPAAHVATPRAAAVHPVEPKPPRAQRPVAAPHTPHPSKAAEQPAPTAPPPEPPPAPEPAPTPRTTEVQQHLTAGREQLRRGAHAGAAAEFLAVRGIDPRNAEAIAGLGEVAFEQGHYQEATVHLKAAVRLQPRRPGFHVLLGNAYYKLGRTRDAIGEYRAALKIKPDSEEARHALEVAEGRLKEGSP